LNARALYIGSEDLVSERPSDRVKIDVSHHRLNIAFFERVHERIEIVQGPSYITEPHQAKGCHRHYRFAHVLSCDESTLLGQAALPPAYGLATASCAQFNIDPMLYRVRPKPPAGFIQPCLPTRADKAPSSVNWIHEIKHDGFRMMVRRDAAGLRLLTRNGIDWTTRFPLIAEAAAALRVKSFLIDGEAVCCDGEGMPVFDRLRYRRDDRHVFLYAFAACS
jgi:hypothetical protein